MKVVIAGGSGLLGRHLSAAFGGRGDEVVVLSRDPAFAAPGVARTAAWDGRTLGPWAGEVDGADVVINLAGRSVNCRYTPANRRLITESRTESTRVVGEAIAGARRPPRAWLQASTATLYAHRFDAGNDEATGVHGTVRDPVPETWNFSTGVALAWEKALGEARTPATRKAALRISIVMSRDRGGAFDVLLGLVRRGLGGRAGDGTQFVSWIHVADFVNAVLRIADDDRIEGPVNLAAPNPLPNADFMRELRAAAGVRFGLPAGRLMLEVGSFLLRTESELVLKSRRVVPGKLAGCGFIFRFPDWAAAARDLAAR